MDKQRREKSKEVYEELLEEIQKSVLSNGYATWPKLRLELKVSYAAVIRVLNYMVKREILSAPDKNGKYFLVDNKTLRKADKSLYNSPQRQLNTLRNGKQDKQSSK